MKGLPAALAVLLLLSGCAAPDAPASADAADATEALAGTGAGTNATSVLPPLQFAGGLREAELPLELSWAATEPCLLVAELCPSAVRRIDLTPVVPADAPVELSIALAGDGNYDLYVEFTETTVLQLVQDYDAGTYRIDATLVRASAGTATLVAQYVLPSVGSAAGATLTGLAHTVARAEVLPPFVPVALQLRPGDLVTVTGHAIDQAVLFPPKGEPIRAQSLPFDLAVPTGLPAGEYVLVVDADEAVEVHGPAGTMVARQLSYQATDPVDVASGSPTTWTMAVAGHPLAAGVVLLSKGQVEGMALGAYAGTHEVKLTNVRGLQVLADGQACVLLLTCGIVIGSYASGYMTGLLDEHLVPGDYAGSVTSDGRNMQAYSWALVVA